MSAIQLKVIGAKTTVTLGHEPTRLALAEHARQVRIARDDATLLTIQRQQPYQTGVNQHRPGLISAGWSIPTGLDLGVKRR